MCHFRKVSQHFLIGMEKGKGFVETKYGGGEKPEVTLRSSNMGGGEELPKAQRWLAMLSGRDCL